MCRNVGVFECNATVIGSYPVHTFALFVIQKSLKFGRACPVLRSFRVLPAERPSFVRCAKDEINVPIALSAFRDKKCAV